jgi:DNA repair exonuclease SbcCD ATPase subunit
MDELIDREFKAIRDLIAANETKRTERREMELAAIRELIAANEHRRADLAQVDREQRLRETQVLNERLAHLNESRETIADQQAHFVQRQEFEDAKVQGIERANGNRIYTDQRIATLTEKTDAAGKPNWHFLTAIASLIMTGIAASWLVIGLKMESTVSPLALTVEQTRVIGAQNAERLRFVENAANASSASDVESKTDRAQLNSRLRTLESESPSGKATSADVANLKTTIGQISDRLQGMRAAQTEQRSALIEVETQFCASDYMRNLMHATDLRLFSLLWAKSYPGERYPTDNSYYPRIGKCGQEGQLGNGGG